MKKLLHLRHSPFNRKEEGQIIILFVLFFVLIGAGAIGSVDYGSYVHSRQRLELAVDAAALAGALELPASTSEATAVAELYINKNASLVDLDDVTTSFYCLLGDRDENGVPDSGDIPAVCDPGASASWTCEDALCISPCAPVSGNICNTMGVTASEDVELVFTSVLGLPPVQITASRTGACRGICGGAPGGAIDVMLIIDRSGSMDGSALDDAKDGALAVLEIFDPAQQHIGLAVLGAGRTSNRCRVADPDGWSGGGEWLVVPLSNDYQNADGSVNMSSQLAQTIDCLDAEGYTNLGSPIYDQYFRQPSALSELINSGREDVPQGIIFLSDGAANRPYSDDSCRYANNMATIAKNHGVEIFTIGYGVEDERCDTDESGIFDRMRVTDLLALMATDSADDLGHCEDSSDIDAENADGDHFLCQPRGGDLEEVFRIAATALSTSVKLVQYPVE